MQSLFLPKTVIHNENSINIYVYMQLFLHCFSLSSESYQYLYNFIRSVIVYITCLSTKLMSHLKTSIKLFWWMNEKLFKILLKYLEGIFELFWIRSFIYFLMSICNNITTFFAWAIPNFFANGSSSDTYLKDELHVYFSCEENILQHYFFDQ